MDITIKDIAKIVGVSKSTVSRALGEYGYVSEKTKMKVLEVADNIGYKPNYIARSMKTGYTQTIGLVVTDIENPFFSRLASGINNAVKPKGYNLIIADTNENIEEEYRAIEVLAHKQIDGLIIVPSRKFDYKNIKLLMNCKFPTVLADRIVNSVNFDSICVTNIESTYEAVSHLIQNGYRKIGFLGDSFKISSNAERLEGYKKALINAGIKYDKDLVREGSYTIESGYDEAMSLLSGSNKVTAIFTSNNFMTIGLLKVLKEIKINVPEQLGIVSFDDMNWLELIKPSITAVAQPIYKLGQTAARQLLARIEADNSPVQDIRLPTKLIVRDSSRPF